VSPAIHDQYAAGLGAGAAAAGDINCGTGTAWVLLANTDRLTPPVCDKAFVCRHPIAGLFGQMLSLGNGGSAIEWVMKLVGRQRASPTEVDALLESVPAGSAGVRCWPLLMPSAQADRPFDRGGRFDALTLGHEPCHLVRAVVEGLACELVRHLRFLTAAGLAASRLTLCGTAAASRVTPQIIADVADLPVACVETSDVSAFGAAMIAYALVERGVDLAALSRRWASGGRTLQPGPNAGVYREMLAQYLAPFAGREGA
jgi:xylulokinase